MGYLLPLQLLLFILKVLAKSSNQYAQVMAANRRDGSLQIKYQDSGDIEWKSFGEVCLRIYAFLL